MSRAIYNMVSSSQKDEEEGVATTIRPSATALLAIDSDDRYGTYAQRRLQPSYPFRFTLAKNEAFLNGFFKRLGLTEFRMNWSLPNISYAWGNNQMLFFWRVGASGPYTQSVITLPDGFYDINELADQIQTQIVSFSTSLAGFSVAISDQDYDGLIFETPLTANIFFYFAPVPTPNIVAGPYPTSIGITVQPNISTNTRQLIDMLNIPQLPTGVGRLVGGVPNLRPMDYVDLVCSQLTYNQELKDASSAPVTRDMIARIYLDDAVPSNAFTSVVNYSGTSSSSLVPTAVSIKQATNTYIFTTTAAAAAAVKEGDIVIISGITEPAGVSGFNSRGTIIGVPKTSSPYQIEVLYDNPPVGLTTGLTFSGASLLTLFSTISTWSIPTGAWSNKVNGVSPFVISRLYPYPKQIRWNNKMPIGNMVFELYDDQGRSIQDLWNRAFPIPSSPSAAQDYAGINYANSFVWNASILVSED